MAEESTTDPAGDKPSILGRMLAPITRFRDNPVYNSLFLVGTLVLVVGVFLLFSIDGSDETTSPDEQLDEALTRLESGDLPTARQMALNLTRSNDLPYQRSGEPLYIFGATMVEEARATTLRDHREKLFLVASRYLEQADDIGVPAGHEGKASYLLGVSMFHSQRYAASLKALLQALRLDPEHQTEIYQLLSLAYLRQTPPMTTEALDASRKFLASPDLPPATTYQGWLDQCEILLAMKRHDDCRELLAKIPDKSKMRPARVAMSSRVALDEGQTLLKSPQPSERKKGLELIRQTRDALIKEDQLAFSENESTPQIRLLIGICTRELGDLRAAEAQFARVRGRHFSTDEGLAATMAEAEIELQLDRYNDSLKSFGRVLERVGDPNRYNNTWLPLPTLQQRILAGYDRILKTGHFAECIALCSLMPPTFPKDSVTELIAGTYEKWGSELLEKSTSLEQTEEKEQRKEARRMWRLAGKTYFELAEMHRGNSKFTDHLWKSANNYLRGQSYQMAEKTIKTYLENEQRSGRAKAMVALGEALLAQGRLDDALTTLTEVVALYPKHPESYQARILGSKAYAGKGEFEKAQTVLDDNLNENSQLSPASLEWRDSLFQQAKLHFRKGRELEATSRKEGVDSDSIAKRLKALPLLEQSYIEYEKARKKFDEIVQRAERNNRLHSERALEAQYLLAESRRNAAKWPRKRLPTETITTTKNAIRRLIRTLLDDAVKHYTVLIRRLNEKRETHELRPVEQGILRNCYFNRADAYFDLEQYQKAIEHYSTATNRYPNHPATVEAFVQMSSCHRRLDEHGDARGMLERAKVVLTRIPDADYKATTRYDKTQWERYLDWLINL